MTYRDLMTGQIYTHQVLIECNLGYIYESAQLFSVTITIASFIVIISYIVTQIRHVI